MLNSSPLSASKITGFIVASINSDNAEILEDKGTEELSGFPLIKDSVRLDDHKQSNSSKLLESEIFVSSAIIPARGE